jgi:hypothetical protein
MNKKKIFVGYCHCNKDEKRLARLKVHLAPLIQQDKIDIWEDTMIEAGDDWQLKITQSLDNASIAILLLSPDFLSSKFITNILVPLLLEKRANSGMRLIGVVCTPCGHKYIPHFAKMKLLPVGEKSLPAGAADMQWVEIVEHLKKTLERDSNRATPVQSTSEEHSIIEPPNNFFEVSHSFKFILNDIGIKFTHPSNAELGLNDLFVMPQLKVSLHSQFQLFSKEAAIEFLLKTSKVLISAPEKGGKTTLARFLFGAFLQVDIVPLLISGSDLNRKSTNDVNALIEKHFIEQYSSEQLTRYRALPASQKALIIDDISTSKLDGEKQKEVLAQFHKMFDSFVVFTHELYQLEGITQPTASNMYLLSFSQVSIAEFSREYQEQLIEKWLNFGEYRDEGSTIAYQTRTIIRHIDTITSKNFLPCTPFVILTVLQSFEMGRPLKVESGTYGYLYELLITETLSYSVSSGKSLEKAADVKTTTEQKLRRDKAEQESMAATLDIKYNLLSLLAYKVHTSQSAWFPESLINDVGNEYNKQYLQNIDIEAFKNDIIARNVIHRERHGFRFRYPYYYYYFTARYLSTRIGVSKYTAAIHAQINTLVSELYKEHSANIVIMLCYLTQDQFVINTLISKAASLFAGHDECRLEEDVRPFIDLMQQVHKVLPEHEIRDFLTQKADLQKLEDEQRNKPLEVDADPDVLSRLNDSFKTIQILGQALRNFSGSLESDIKINMAEDSCKLGFRLLGFVLKHLGEGIPVVARALAASIQKQDAAEQVQWKLLGKGEFKVRNDDQIVDEVRTKLIEVSVAISQSVIKHISTSIGADDLRGVFKAFLSASVSHKILGECIKMDHYKAVNLDELFDLYKSLKSTNIFASRVLRNMVYNYILLGDADWKSKQMVCNKFNITYNENVFSRGGREGYVKDRKFLK